MEEFNYKIYSAGPMDHFDGYVHVSDISQMFESFIRQCPRSDKTFNDLWHIVLHKLYWAWTKSGKIDLVLRQPDFWVRMISLEDHVQEIFVVFKADNNGTVYAVVDNVFDQKDNVKNNLYHEFGGDWEEVK